MDKQSFLAIVSPKAGNYRKDIVREISDQFSREGRAVDFLPMDDQVNLSTEIARAHNNGYYSFLSIGGDGTTSLLATSLYGKPHRLGIIPLGTTNTLARVLGIPLSVKESIEVAARSDNIRSVDGLEVNGRVFILNVSVGLSSVSLENVDSIQKSRFGILAYVWGIIRNSKRIKTQNYSIQIDDHFYDTRAVELHVTNTGIIGMPQFHIYRGSRIDDGKAEVLTLRHWSITEIFNAALDILTQRERQAIRLVGIGENILIQSQMPVAIQADGDLLRTTPVSIRVLHQVINFIIP